MRLEQWTSAATRVGPNEMSTRRRVPGNNLPLDAEAEAEAVQRTAQCKLGLGVALGLKLHASPRTRRRIGCHLRRHALTVRHGEVMRHTRRLVCSANGAGRPNRL